MSSDSSIKENLQAIVKDIGKTNLIAVSKYSSVDEIQTAYDAGHRDFGENRVQDLLVKSSHFFNLGLHDIRWHFIGNLQSNKINKLFTVQHLVSIHSVDNLKLLEDLISKENQLQRNVYLFLQVNTSAENEKGGFKDFDSLKSAYDYFNSKRPNNLILKGLMTMGSIRSEDFEKAASESFKLLFDYKEKLNKDLQLSMGMSSDYKIALKYNTNYIRVGSAIFKSA